MKYSPSADKIIVSVSINIINIVMMVIETTFDYCIQPKSKNQAPNPESKSIYLNLTASFSPPAFNRITSPPPSPKTGSRSASTTRGSCH
jgi:hypothetical protein